MMALTNTVTESLVRICKHSINGQFIDPEQYLLRGYLISVCPEVNLDMGVHTWDREEDTRPLGSAPQKSAQPEDYGPLILLEHSNKMNHCSNPDPSGL